MPALSTMVNVSCESMRFTPAAIAVSDSPLRKLIQAWCAATKLDEQAVLIAILGPERFKK